jgi:hypothetical protein
LEVVVSQQGTGVGRKKRDLCPFGLWILCGTWQHYSPDGIVWAAVADTGMPTERKKKENL